MLLVRERILFLLPGNLMLRAKAELNTNPEVLTKSFRKVCFLLYVDEIHHCLLTTGADFGLLLGPGPYRGKLFSFLTPPPVLSLV